ncbi:MAG: DUF4147 domain-containing protein, partial [bacterium]|nr:DUF4147 domain-containing protein [bacterium]
VRQTWYKIIEEALAAVDPVRLMRESLRIDGHRLFVKDRPFDLKTFDKLHVISVGKGAPFMFEGLNEVIGDRISGGVVVSLPAHRFKHDKVNFHAGAHPVPDQSSLEAGRAVIKYIKNHVGIGDLVFFLVTGGASSLMVRPAKGLGLEDKIQINQLLLECGAEINEVNCVRKCISALKGGELARLVYPARVISMVLSDVIDSPLSDIGSGPSIINTATNVNDAVRILQKYGLGKQLSPAGKAFFKSAVVVERKKKLPLSETHPGLEENAHFLLADNRIALEAAKRSAEEMGIETHILTSRDRGEASEAAKLYAAIIKEILYTRTPFKPPVLLLSGGELTVTLKPKPGTRKITGKGGRNQEFVLQMLKQLKTITKPFYISSVGTDGIDGSTDAAGSWIDQDSHLKSKELDLDIDLHLADHNSYHFFREMDQLITTGPTRTNVMDLRMFYISTRQSKMGKKVK